jgi:putative serine/threonine protein kinase
MKNKLFAKGNRGLVYISEYKGKKIVIKKKNPASTAAARIEIEAMFLKKMNKLGIGPKFYFFKDGELGMEFLEGELFEAYIVKEDKKKILKVIKDVYMQMYKLDKAGINKKEMHHPTKHIIISKKVTLIDFERCQYTEKPKNVTQFTQYISKKRISYVLKEKGIEVKKDILKKAAEYKKEMNEKSLKKIIASVC